MSRRVVFAVALTLGLVANAAAEEPATTEGVAAAAASDEKVEELAGRFESALEQLQLLQSDTDKLKLFKFSGYLQARWEAAESSNDSVSVSSSGLKPANVERFYIRRARLKLTYDATPTSQAVVYFDAGADRDVQLLEAYLTLMDPWTPEHTHQLTFGQMNVPFGYEIERSSSVRELPERSLAENRLFPGERDRGIKLVDRWVPQFETTIGVLNGGGIKDPDFPTLDPTAKKDWLVRGRVLLGVVDGSVTWYQGEAVVPLSGPDVTVDRTRFGADLQAYYELPSLGGGSLRGELYGGHNPNPDSLKALLTSTSGSPRLLVSGRDPAHLATDVIGWYVMWVQNFGDKWQAVARVDAYDPNQDVDHDQFERTSLGVNWFWDGYTRLTVSYDMPSTEGAGPAFRDPKDNLWTVQLQHKFAARRSFMHRLSSRHARTARASWRSRSSSGAAVAVLAAAVAVMAHAGRGLTVKGSDTMVILGQRWAEAYMNTHQGAIVQVTGGGSGTGIAALINGTTDVCQSSRPMKDAEKAKLKDRYQTSGVEIPVARDGITIYVNEGSPIGELSIEQLRDLFTGKITNWKAIGGPDAAIVLYGRENSSGTYVYFKDHVLLGRDYSPRTQTLPGTAAVVNAVAKDPLGIGYGGAAYAKGVKALAVKPDAASAAVHATAETIRDGSYPISRYLYFYLRRKPAGEIKQFVDWVLSTDGQTWVTQVGYFPVR